MSNPLRDVRYPKREDTLRRKLIYLTSFLFILSLASIGWSNASNPNPRDGAIHDDTWASLSWRPGEHAASHDIYIGVNYDDVRDGIENTFVGNQEHAFFVVGFPGFPFPDGLVPGTTYYWRIDEVNDLHPDSPWTGEVWNFMITPVTAYAPVPADGARFVDPNVTLRWEKGFNAKLHTVYFGDNFEEVSNAIGGFPQGVRSFVPGLLESGKTYYWREDEFDAIKTHKGDVWSFTVGAGVPPDVVGGTIYVDAVNGGDNNDGLTPETAFATIQKGIDSAIDGEVVLVYPGLYQEKINFNGKSIKVQGVVTSPAGVPELQNPDDFAVSFSSGEGRDSILKNLIISNSFMGVFIPSGSPTIRNLTIVNNKYGIEAYGDSEPDISNCIIWGNLDDDLSPNQINYSCVERGGEGEGNISDDPLFADPNMGDYHLRSERGRYWPKYDIWVLDKVTSPCIDRGDPNSDYSNEPVPNGVRINIGAYGGTLEASLSPSAPPTKAYNPSPPNGAVSVGLNSILSWTAGLSAVSHDVYFGTNSGAVASADPTDTTGVYRGRQSATSYNPPEGLTDDKFYYWRIDEINSDGIVITGDLWTFTTAQMPGPKGRGCFPADTPVLVNGALLQISNVVSGQMVGKLHCEKVTGCLEQIEIVEEHEGTFVCRDIMLESGQHISVVDAHCFMLDSGRWIAAQDLRSGLKLKTINGTVSIKSVTTRAKPFLGKVYNLKVAGSDQYLVGEDFVIVRDY